jgi:CMP-N-acetylneuraminic acid synthetase
MDGSSLAQLPVRRQLLEPTYWRNGEIYVAAAATLLHAGQPYTEPTLGIVTAGLVNIDTPEELERARALVGHGDP